MPIPEYRVYVSNIHFDATEGDLEEYFLGHGYDPVDVFIPRDKNYRDRWKNRGFGFVEFDTERERDDAISTLNNAMGPGNRIITLKIADKRTPSWIRE